MHADGLLRALRDEPRWVAELVRLFVDDVLARPLGSLVEPQFVAQTVADLVRASARADELEHWVARRVREALARADRLEGPLADRIPATLLEPIETALRREIVFDPDLVRAMIDHDSVRALIREVLHDNILEFGRRMRDIIPDVRDKVPLPRSSVLGSLADMAKGVAEVVGSEASRKLEPRVSAYVDGALATAVDTCVRRMCDAEHADELASWRVDVFHALLQQPLERLVAEGHKVKPEDLAGDVAAILRALAGWKQLASVLEEAVRELVEQHADESLHDFLAGSGLESGFRPALEEALTREARAFVSTPAFSTFLHSLEDSLDS